MPPGLTRIAWIPLALAAALFALAAGAQSPAPKAGKTRQLHLDTRPWKGDFDAMLERRQIRVLVPYSRSLYFVDKGHERGLTAEHARDFERYINRKYAKQLRKRPVTVYILPTTRDKLLSGVTAGLGDIAAGNLTATEGRQRIVDFIVTTDRKPVQELVVTGPGAPAVATVEELSGKTMHVRPASSYYDSVVALNGRLAKARKAPVAIARLPDELEDEDVLEMLNAGLLQFAVVDDWKAKMWAQILPKIKVREDLVMRAEGRIGWAVRKGSPKLAAEVADFNANFLKKHGVSAARHAQYHARVAQIGNNTARDDLKRFERTLKLFEQYGARYRFDPLMLAAQGYQESKLRQEARSHTGAVGIMQIMPATGKALKVGDIHQIEPNIHAGAKYMDQLMTVYFPDASFSEAERPLFAFASYNCGPGRVARMRKEAEKRGLDPDKWFNNVELVVAEKVGMETTTYVRNIYKYYAAYKLVLEAEHAGRRARAKLEDKRAAR